MVAVSDTMERNNALAQQMDITCEVNESALEEEQRKSEVNAWELMLKPVEPVIMHELMEFWGGVASI